MIRAKKINIPFLIITISTFLGILTGYYWFQNIQSKLIILSISIIVLVFALLRSGRIFSKSYFFTFTTIIVFILFGTTLVDLHNPKNKEQHYTHFITSKNDINPNVGIKFHIHKRLKPTSYYEKYIVSVTLLNNTDCQGKVLLQLPKDSTNIILNIGNTYTAYAKLKPISKPINPDQFDYAKYLENNYLFHQITLSYNQLIDNHTQVQSVFYYSDQIRKHINSKLSQYSFNKKQLSIINALLLGQRQGINPETFREYRDAGAIHILAISGLHIGILLGLFNIVFKPLEKLGRVGKTIKLVLVISLLWIFAVIAGLSPSVLRAVTMFSFLSIGIQIRSRTSIYDSLFISMFILLCFDPLLLFSVGFQLSYTAVFAILWIQPLLANLYQPKFYISKKLWETFTVTIAAQLGLLPLTLFYFHQFPLLFFISNLIIIPFLGLILGCGILIILLALTGLLSEFIANWFGHCINFMNDFISLVAQQEFFLITNITFSWRMLILLYLVIITSIRVFYNSTFSKIYLCCISIILLFSVLIYEKHQNINNEELIVFHHHKKTVIGVLKNQKFTIYSSDSIPEKTKTFLFSNYLIKKQAKVDSFVPLKNSYKYKNKTILVIDSFGIHPITKVKPDIVLLSGSPKIHLTRIIDSLKPKQIIADASNYKSYIDRWENSCKKENILFYRTDKKGAFILN
ncbi:ComEC/Rec2 family competence protein [Aquimarina sp. 2201CG5-10]|uniref:ComEC/Rec2 family competence protein n=1 Tax=Aquimarina callyspongiae TaxID=3098150 RepID=UPI002AB4B810|nr:ComEC/Rec2 family competence protein [Aquimarina sp. 2201CG5-10]MDY8137626.1 ComEC/Rec2 family competence protein [Aquimarina sp. 2201CG5-10]